MKHWKIYAILAALAFVVGAIAFRGCQCPALVFPAGPAIALPSPTPSPSPQVRSEASATTSGTSKGRLRLEIPANLLRGTGSGGAAEQVQPVMDGQKNASTGSVQGPFSGIVVEFEQELTSGASATGSASISPSTPQPSAPPASISPLGAIAATVPGAIALDYRLLGWGPIGLDLEGNHRQVGAGISIGTKAIGTGGVYLGFDGGRGVYVGAGVRF